MAYSPAFQFYPGEYLGDKNTIPMTTEENGAYCLLMWVCWEQDGLPESLEDLAEIARLPLKKFEPLWNRRIKKCFFWDDKKKVFFHSRFVKEIKKQKAWSKKKSDAGKKGMESRWKKEKKSKISENSEKKQESFPQDVSDSRQKGNADNTDITVLGSVITDDNSSSLSSSSSSLKEETPRLNKPALVLYEEMFGTTGVKFGEQIQLRVKDLGLWEKLLSDKSSFADDPLKRKGVPKWILSAYDEYVDEKKNERKQPDRLPTLEEKIEERKAGLKNLQSPPADFVSGVLKSRQDHSATSTGSGQA